MNTKLLLTGLTLSLLFLSIPSQAKIKLDKLAKQKWTRVTTPHLNIVTDAKPKIANKMAKDLENFRHFLSVNAGYTPLKGAPPLTILALSKTSNFRALDLPERWAGLFNNHIDGPFFIANISGYSSSDHYKSWGSQAVMHEFVHYAAASKIGRYIYPLWYSEGMAEYLASFRLIENGKTISVGSTKVVGNRAYDLLNRSYTKLMSLDIEDLLKTRSLKMSWRNEKNSRKKSEGKRAVSKFYARAVWAYHYLHSSVELANKTTHYIDLLNQGRSVDSAFNIAYEGISYKEMDLAMYNYLKGRYHMHWKFSAGDAGIEFPEINIKQEELNKAAAIKAITQTLVRLELFGIDERNGLLEKAISLNPDDSELIYDKILLQRSQGESIDGKIESALKQDPDNLAVQVLKGRQILTRGYHQQMLGDSEYTKTIRKGRNVLRTVLKQSPFNARAYEGLAYIANITAETHPPYLKEACVAAESARILNGDKPIHIMRELDCRIKLKQPEVATILLRKYATQSVGDWIDTGYGRFMLDAFNLRAQALAKPIKTEKQKLIYDDGSVYLGSHQNDLPHGKGTLKLENGSTATGNWSNGKLEGNGNFIASNRYHYTGNFEDGTLTGKGQINYPQGIHIKSSSGEFLYAIEHGNHRFEYSTGLIIKGETHVGYHHGQQLITLPNGDQLPVTFVRNRIRITEDDNSIFIGWMNDNGEIQRKGLCFSPDKHFKGKCKREKAVRLTAGT